MNKDNIVQIILNYHVLVLQSADKHDLIEYSRVFHREETEGTKKCNEADVWKKV